MDLSEFVSIRMTSSANKLIYCWTEVEGIPVTGGLALMEDARGSMSKGKIIGDRGQSCLVKGLEQYTGSKDLRRRG